MPLRRALADLEPYRPQRPLRELKQELGLARLVKLSSNEGAFGPLPAAVAAFEWAAGELNRYPDGGGLRLREALAERHGVPLAQVVLGNGADELIRLCAIASLESGERGAFPWPSFPSYLASVVCCGADAVQTPLSGRGFDLDALLEAARAPRTKLVYVANPNNPTGTLVERGELRRFLDELPPNVLCVLDEAYADYADPEPEGIALVRRGRPRLCALRTFSKVYGLAALRVGYAIASPEVADTLDRVRNIFNVSQPAQEAALASLRERDAVAERVAHARRSREPLRAAMAAAGLDSEPSQANFVFADVPNGGGAALAERLLLRAGVMIRSLEGFGAPGAIRVTVGTEEENVLVGEALARLAQPPA
jgi:histidinol-phosphate aminotransferase